LLLLIGNRPNGRATETKEILKIRSQSQRVRDPPGGRLLTCSECGMGGRAQAEVCGKRLILLDKSLNEAFVIADSEGASNDSGSTGGEVSEAVIAFFATRTAVPIRPSDYGLCARSSAALSGGMSSVTALQIVSRSTRS
jgi:hypothetical protein